MFDKSADHGNDVMMAQFVFLFLSCAIFPETSTEVDDKTVNVILKNKSTTILHGLHSYRHGSDVKMFKTLQWNRLPATRCSTCFLTILTSSAMVNNSTDYGRLLSIFLIQWHLCFYPVVYFILKCKEFERLVFFFFSVIPGKSISTLSS